ncbi:MAG: magnesium/cobalt transporter CorA [Cyanobacteriota bacterium]|nr:magnesium/cobalt transporter CorA [Cyanobacteriota bacterium]
MAIPVLRLTPGALSSQLLEQRPAGLPGHLFVNGGLAPTRLDAVLFDEGGPRLLRVDRPDGLAALRAGGRPLWLRLRGLHDRALAQAALTALEVPQVLHAPLLEVPQRPQVDCLEEAVLVVLHRFSLASTPDRLISDQVGLLLVPGLLITVEEDSSGEAFSSLTRWLLSRTGVVEDQDLDDILHFVVDAILDELFPILEHVSHRLDDLEEAALRHPRPQLLNRTFRYRTNLRAVRAQIWPLRHQIRVLLRQQQPLLGPEATGGFQEMLDIVELLFENCEMLRYQCDAITQAYAASVGNRMNQVMKTLTILTTIFAPLTFIAGIYGMNFERMPELSWAWGYAYALVLMAVVAGLQTVWLWRRGWFQDWTASR